MDKSFFEISRVLKQDGFLCIVIGQGKGRVNTDNVIENLLKLLKTKYKFKIFATFPRKIKFRRIQTYGVDNEYIFILNRKLLDEFG
jgi:hypothetical protein